MMKQRVMKPCRSALFVPGNKPSWVEKAVASGVDSPIIDLEDSVPVADKRSARLQVKEALIALDEHGQDCSVRINGLATGMTLDDLQTIMCPELKGVGLPKVETVEEMEQLDALLTRLEEREGIEPGSVKTGIHPPMFLWSMKYSRRPRTKSPTTRGCLQPWRRPRRAEPRQSSIRGT